MKFKCLWYSIFCVLLVVITLNLVYAQHPHLDTIRERIETRTYPSIFAAWGGVGNPPRARPSGFEFTSTDGALRCPLGFLFSFIGRPRVTVLTLNQ